MKQPKIIMAVTNDLVTDQRVHRSSAALIEAGYQVLLVGRRMRHSQPVTLNCEIHRMRLLFNKKALFYAEYNLRLFLLLLFTPCCIIFANDTDTLLACWLAARIRRKPLVYDAHELFCEVPELVGRPRVQAVWRRIEEMAIPHVDHGFTVCQSLVDIFHQRYGIKMTVVRNLPSANNPAPEPHVRNPKSTRMLLYQGAVNVGRGVDWMIEAMEHLPDCRFVVAGDGDELQKMRQLAASKPWSDRIEFLGRVVPDQLRQLTANADLGISLLADMGLNYYYSLPNRIADFVQAGVPILATDFPEIRRVIQAYGVGSLISTHTPLQLAKEVRSALDYWDAIDEDSYRQIFAQARQDLNWDQDKHHLQNAIRTILDPKTVR